jgi:hypothetical protein
MMMIGKVLPIHIIQRIVSESEGQAPITETDGTQVLDKEDNQSSNFFNRLLD